MVNLIIDNTPVEVPQGTTVLDAAATIGIRIPTLCAMGEVSRPAACRVCVVEVEGQERLASSCTLPVAEGMVVRTHTPRVVEARRRNVELILSEHRTSCTTCLRSDTCALRQLAADLNVQSAPFAENVRATAWDPAFPLQRDATKCIKCMRCVAECAEVQGCRVWELAGTGSRTAVSVADGVAIDAAGCTLCGQCVTHCPTGALTARDDTARVLAAIADPDVITVVNVAPAVRTAWGEGIGLDHEEATPGRMVSALRRIGFDYVFDTDFAADLTIMEEGTELVERITHHDDYPWPMFTSCCPGWVRFVKLHYPEFLPNLSSAKAPHQMFGAVAKTYFAEEVLGVERSKLFVVSIMPCLAKKYEAGVAQLDDAGTGHDIDVSLTVREFDHLIRACGIEPGMLPEDDFDAPLGLSTGAGVIFGRTGGVMEAALRSAGALIDGVPASIEACRLDDCTPEVLWNEKIAHISGLDLRIAVASGLGNTRALLDAIKAGMVQYDFVEIMACPGGCVGGGGQPISFDEELAPVRAEVIWQLDQGSELRMSHENPAVQELYQKFLGTPCGHLAHELLHTDQSSWTI